MHLVPRALLSITATATHGHPAWTDPPRAPAHLRQNPLSQVSHLSQLSQLSRALRRSPRLNMTRLTTPQNQPAPI